MRQFDNIKDRTGTLYNQTLIEILFYIYLIFAGTLIVIYNVKLLDSGSPELDVASDPTDIRMAEMDLEDKKYFLVLTETNRLYIYTYRFKLTEYTSYKHCYLSSNWPERMSFKAYVSILYLDPRMIVYVQGKKVRTKRLADSLYKPK